MKRSVYILCVFALVACQHGDRGGTVPNSDELFEGVSAKDLYNDALLHAQSGDFLRAEQYLVAAEERGHPAAETVPWLVRVSIASSRYQSALGYAEPFLRTHPDDWSLRLLVANIRVALGDAELARQELDQVIRAVPEEPLPHYHLGTLYAESLGDHAAAAEHYERYLELSPDGKHAAEARGYLKATAVISGGPKRIEAPTETQQEGAP